MAIEDRVDSALIHIRAQRPHRVGKATDDLPDGCGAQLVEDADADLHRFGQGGPDAEAFGAAAAGFLAIILALTPGADPPFFPWPFCFCCCVGLISPCGLGLGYSFFPSALFF